MVVALLSPLPAARLTPLEQLVVAGRATAPALALKDLPAPRRWPTNDPRPAEERIGVDERYAKIYNIDYGRCIFCGYCVEACPKDAITHGYNFELSVYNRADLLKRKDDLLITKQIQSKNYRVAFSDEDVDSEYKEV